MFSQTYFCVLFKNPSIIIIFHFYKEKPLRHIKRKCTLFKFLIKNRNKYKHIKNHKSHTPKYKPFKEEKMKCNIEVDCFSNTNKKYLPAVIQFAKTATHITAAKKKC